MASVPEWMIAIAWILQLIKNEAVMTRKELKTGDHVRYCLSDINGEVETVCFFSDIKDSHYSDYVSGNFVDLKLDDGSRKRIHFGAIIPFEKIIIRNYNRKYKYHEIPLEQMSKMRSNDRSFRKNTRTYYAQEN